MEEAGKILSFSDLNYLHTVFWANKSRAYIRHRGRVQSCTINIITFNPRSVKCFQNILTKVRLSGISQDFFYQVQVCATGRVLYLK